MLWRQGDLFIESVEAVPEGASRRDDGVLAEGELTGHSHRVDDLQAARVHERLDEMFIEVVGQRVAVDHQEHATILLPQGVYRVWRQREYVPPRVRPTRPMAAWTSPVISSSSRIVRD